LNTTGSLLTAQQLSQLPGSTETTPSEQQHDSSTAEDGGSQSSSSTNGGSTAGGDGSTAAETGIGSASSSRSSMSDGLLQTHSRAGDASEDSIIKSGELESIDDDYHG
jgi:hypothetical protein